MVAQSNRQRETVIVLKTRLFSPLRGQRITQASTMSWKLPTEDDGATDRRNLGPCITTWRRPYESKTSDSGIGHYTFGLIL